ncbi:MAG TPA: glutamate--cysteine ligase [Micromonosporaceae bacterium]|nr:glutamate--cysteine ligase [Micromonosporaceae bacterium]
MATVTPVTPGAGHRLRPAHAQPASCRTAAAPTLGVEEEFVLLDPASGLPALAAPDLLRLLDGEPGPQAEYMRFQFETVTRVCTRLDEVRSELLRLRRLAAAGAEHLGCRLVATGVAPYPVPGLAALTDQARYRELARRYPRQTPESGTCACHVHVGVPSRDLGVQVLARLRPWLAPLLALSANSAIADGQDTAWASWRYPLVSRWPTARPPAVWADAAHYDATIRRLIRQGAALDQASVYFLARLSARYPTVEVRVADVCPDIDTAVLLAALVRALVTTALAEARSGARLRPVRDGRVAAGLVAAARHGLGGYGVDPFTGRQVPQHSLLDRLLDQVHAALDATGDADEVAVLLRRLDERGTGADRQRAMWSAAGSARDFTEALAAATRAVAADQTGPDQGREVGHPAARGERADQPARRHRRAQPERAAGRR